MAQLVEDRKKAERDISQLRRKIATVGSGSVAGNGIGGDIINGVTFVGRLLTDTPARELKSMAENKILLEKAVVCLVATDAGKASIVVAVTPDMIDQKNVVDLVKLVNGLWAAAGVGVLIWPRLVVRMLTRQRMHLKLFRLHCSDVKNFSTRWSARLLVSPETKGAVLC